MGLDEVGILLGMKTSAGRQVEQVKQGPLPGLPFPHRVVPAGRREDLRRETELLLGGLTAATLPPALHAKLDAMGLVEFFGLEESLQMLASKLAILTSRM